jgi:hypothetical protein
MSCPLLQNARRLLLQTCRNMRTSASRLSPLASRLSPFASRPDGHRGAAVPVPRNGRCLSSIPSNARLWAKVIAVM